MEPSIKTSSKDDHILINIIHTREGVEKA